MSDVKDILGVSQSRDPPTTSATVDGILRKKSTATRESVGGGGRLSIIDKLQQSFKSLEGETLTFSAPVAQYKEKRKIKINYETRGFRNSARKDNLILHHWVKSNEKIDDYKYSKFNKQMEVLVYTEEEYDLYLRDPNWTKEDTDQLLELCKRFDTRFIIVTDRFQGSLPKTSEDLKERYYKIQSKLVELRTKPEEDPYHNPLTGYNFNKVYEVERKAQSDQIFHLSKEQVMEEESLMEKYSNIEKHLLKHSKESKSIMKLANVAINNGALSHYSPQDLQTESQIKKSKKRKSMDASSSAADDKLLQISSNRQAARVEAALFEFHIGRPYQNNVAKKLYNDLRQDLVILLDLQKYYMEKRYHLEILKAQKEHLEKEIQDMNLPPEALLIQVEEDVEPTTTASEDSNQQQVNTFQMYSGGEINPSGIINTNINNTVDLTTSSNSLITSPLNQSITSTSTSSTTTSSTTPVSEKKVTKKKSSSSHNDESTTGDSETPSTTPLKKKKVSHHSTTTTPTGSAEKKTKKKSTSTTSATDNIVINLEGGGSLLSPTTSSPSTTPQPIKKKSTTTKKKSTSGSTTSTPTERKKKKSIGSPPPT